MRIEQRVARRILSECLGGCFCNACRVHAKGSLLFICEVAIEYVERTEGRVFVRWWCVWRRVHRIQLQVDCVALHLGTFLPSNEAFVMIRTRLKSMEVTKAAMFGRFNT